MSASLRVVCVFHCDPWESWIQQQIAECEALQRIEEYERDAQWEIDNGLHDVETDIEMLPVELLPCLGFES